jgi:hypothetical protein
MYVEASEKDEPNLPLVCYTVAFLLLKIGQDKKAVAYWHRGVDAEKCSLELPFREALEREMYEYKASVRMHMLARWDAMNAARRPPAAAAAQQTPAAGGEGTVRVDGGGELKCGECGKAETALSLCGRCGKIRYCGRECQKKHWPTHKKSCANK